MKSNFFFLILILVSANFVSSQTDSISKPSRTKRERVTRISYVVKQPATNFKNKQRELYNHWSLEFNVGSNKPVAPFESGFYASDPNRFSNLGAIDHYNFGLRYMASNIFGVRVGVGYDKISNLESNSSGQFNLSLYTASFEGVLNLGRLARFETFTNRLNVLTHFGLQTTYKTVNTRLGVTVPSGTGKSEQDGGIVFGLSPQVRITDRISILADFSYFTNFRQHINWDGSRNNDRNLNGTITTSTLGINFALGKIGRKHADWYILQPNDTEIEDMTKRIVDLEAQLTDSDRDGVPDFRDLEINTPNGLTVDQKGRFIDEDKNGKPDQLESKIVLSEIKTGNVVNNAVTSNGNNNNTDDITTQLIQKGYFNIFYEINRDEPNDASSDNIYQIIKYLKTNPTAKVKLIGHTDKTGDAFANKDLSERRAKSLFNLIKASGVDATRIKIEGVGVDNDVPSDYKAGNNIARRVSVIIEQ
jgi:OOP family OmpA-OmpF porin